VIDRSGYSIGSCLTRFRRWLPPPYLRRRTAQVDARTVRRTRGQTISRTAFVRLSVRPVSDVRPVLSLERTAGSRFVRPLPPILSAPVVRSCPFVRPLVSVCGWKKYPFPMRIEQSMDTMKAIACLVIGLCLTGCNRKPGSIGSTTTNLSVAVWSSFPPTNAYHHSDHLQKSCRNANTLISTDAAIVILRVRTSHEVAGQNQPPRGA